MVKFCFSYTGLSILMAKPLNNKKVISVKQGQRLFWVPTQPEPVHQRETALDDLSRSKRVTLSLIIHEDEQEASWVRLVALGSYRTSRGVTVHSACGWATCTVPNKQQLITDLYQYEPICIRNPNFSLLILTSVTRDEFS